ncbi:MAG: hypothetical protein ACREMD_02985, partial [Gemmatimonadota bacterium]
MLDRAATRPRTVLAAGGFDELYFFYFEDLVAPGWRLAQRRLPVVVGQRRYQILVRIQATGQHVGRPSSAARTPTATSAWPKPAASPV